MSSSSSSNVPPRLQSTLSVAISAVRNAPTYNPTLPTPSSSNTNALFILLAFSGHGAELVRRETADPASNLRVVFQSACEYDITEMIRHLNISVHHIRAIGGAPATNLVIRQKFLDSASDPGIGNRISCDQSLFCAISVRTNSPQQCKAIYLSLRGSLSNSYNYHHVNKLLAKVCRSRPNRLYGDVKARTPYDSPLFVSTCKLQEISQNVLQQPTWYSSFFATPSHMVHPSEVERFLIDDETARMKMREMLLFRKGQNSSASGPPVYLDYRNNSHHHIINQQQQQYHHHQAAENISRNNNNTTTTIIASDEDAMFVPTTQRSTVNSSSSMIRPEHIARAVASNDPIVLSKHRL